MIEKRDIYFLGLIILGLLIAFIMLKYGGTVEEMGMTNALIN